MNPMSTVCFTEYKKVCRRLDSTTTKKECFAEMRKLNAKKCNSISASALLIDRLVGHSLSSQFDRIPIHNNSHWQFATIRWNSMRASNKANRREGDQIRFLSVQTLIKIFCVRWNACNRKRKTKNGECDYPWCMMTQQNDHWHSIF